MDNRGRERGERGDRGMDRSMDRGLDRGRHGHQSRRHHIQRRVVYAVPSGLTFANLFFGLFAIVAASRGDLLQAGWYVVLGGIADMLDGRVARATNSGTRLGAELDSLVDVITFGVAPGMIMYFAVLNRNGWDWIWVFAYVACAAARLALFNVEQAGRAKKYFRGLPSPAAGLTLATYYAFSQTQLYSQTNIVNLPWHYMLRFIMIGLAALMISPIPYSAFPPVGFRNLRQILGSIVVVVVILGVFLIPRQFFFPACLAYVVYGLLKTAILGLLNLRAEDDDDVAERSARTMVVREPERERERTRDWNREPTTSITEPSVTIASTPRLSVSADTPLPPAPNRRRRRRRPRGDRPPDRDRSDRPDNSPPPPKPPSNPPGE